MKIVRPDKKYGLSLPLPDIYSYNLAESLGKLESQAMITLPELQIGNILPTWVRDRIEVFLSLHNADLST